MFFDDTDDFFWKIRMNMIFAMRGTWLFFDNIVMCSVIIV